MSELAMMNGDVLKICLISVRQGPCESSGKEGDIYIQYLQMEPNSLGPELQPI